MSFGFTNISRAPHFTRMNTLRNCPFDASSRRIQSLEFSCFFALHTYEEGFMLSLWSDGNRAPLGPIPTSRPRAP